MVPHLFIILRISGFRHGTAAGITIRFIGTDLIISVILAGTVRSGTDTMPGFMQACTIRTDTDTVMDIGVGTTTITTATTAAITIMGTADQPEVLLTVPKQDVIQAAQPPAATVLPIVLKLPQL